MSKPTLDLKVPSVGESVTEVEIGGWLKKPGELVRKDESIVVLETDKATVEIPAPATGRLVEVLKTKGQRVQVGEVLGRLESGDGDADGSPATATATAPPASAAPEAQAAPSAQRAPSPPPVMPAAARLIAQSQTPQTAVEPTGPKGHILKENVQRSAAAPKASAQPPPSPPATPPAPPTSAPRPAPASGERGEEVVPMSLLRRKVAERLVRAQNTAALLTTFNEVDMSAVMATRKDLQESFQKRYQVKLGFMSFFVKASVAALEEFPALNAEIRGASIVYRNYCDIGIAIGGGRGLVVPVLRDAQRMSFAEIELAIADFSNKARENKIRPEDLAGGTFTISNGGVYGSMLSTPLLNPPQSGVLGMHAIQERPIALAGQVVIRPMMFLALTYDHRLVDGREAVTFLKRVKELVESPARMMVET